MSVVGVLSSIGQTVFKLSFEISPIMFVNGIAGQIYGGMLPIVAFTEAPNFVLGLLSGSDVGLDDFFAHFTPLPGSTLFDLQIGSYPFANMGVASNATIQMPLTLSYIMRCPARGPAGYLAKLAVMTALQQVIQQHAQMGGSYTCLTPASFYTNGILKTVRDISDMESHQAQNAFQFDFEFPLLTLEQIQTAQSSLMAKLTNQTQISGAPAWTSPAATVGAPATLAGSSLLPVAQGLPAVVPGL